MRMGSCSAVFCKWISNAIAGHFSDESLRRFVVRASFPLRAWRR